MSNYEKFEKQFIQRTKKSKEMYEEARKYLPGGVPGNGRFMKPYPLYWKDAKGARIIDVDGNEYIDMRAAGGPIILGYNPPAVVEAVKAQLEHGTHTFLTSKVVFELAKKICQHMRGVEMIRFVNSGSEAGHFALRAARVYTGRPKIAKFEGNFVGSFCDEFISTQVFSGPEDSPEPIADIAGIPESCYKDIVVLPFNNIEASVSLIRKHAKELACVIMEPLANFALAGVLAEKPFMEAIRRVTEEEGILLIWDEVVSGFRFGLGGLEGYYNIVPDMRTLGKIIGGGFPVGAYGGKREIMDKAVTPTGMPSDKKEKAFQSGTFSGNEITAAAGLALISELERKNPYSYIDGLGERLRSGWRKIADDLGIKLQVTGIGSYAGLMFADQPIRNLRDYGRVDLKKGDAFRLGLYANGVTFSKHNAFMNAALSEEDIDEVLSVSGHVLREINASITTAK